MLIPDPRIVRHDAKVALKCDAEADTYSKAVQSTDQRLV
jgi:hypothetical protein